MNTLSKTQCYKIGYFDKAGRYYLYTEFETQTSRAIRSPSRAWNLSIWQHVKTVKYYKSLSTEQLAVIEGI